MQLFCNHCQKSACGKYIKFLNQSEAKLLQEEEDQYDKS